GFARGGPDDDVLPADLRARCRDLVSLGDQRGDLVRQLAGRHDQLDPFHALLYYHPMAIHLYIKDPRKDLGVITEEQLQVLVDLLEEEDDEDQDYWIDADILDYLAEEGADPALIGLLRPHVTEDDGVEVEWKKE